MDGIVSAFVGALGFFYYILVYGVGAAAMALSISAHQFRRRITILLFILSGQVCWVLYFLLQGDLTSACASGLTAIMLAVFTKKDKWPWATKPVTVAAFALIIALFSLLSYRTWTDIFPLLAGVFTVLSGSRENEKNLRILALFYCVFWTCNSIAKFYPVALANDLFCTVSTVVALVRFRQTEKKD